MNNKIILLNRWSLALVVIIGAFLSASCSSSDVRLNLSAEERFELGMRKFNDEDYLEAINEFEIVKLQFPGSTVADDAQYYLGDCHFKLGEYLIAAEEYRILKRNMEASPLLSMAQYNIAMCFYNLSPESSLDQIYTRNAIDELQTFVEYYPTHELVRDAELKIKELNTRLAKKIYDTAELYMKMEYNKAATIYFSTVVEKYHDTQYAEPALLGKAKALVSRKKYDEAGQEIIKFLQKYPQSALKSEAESLQRNINEHLKSQSSALGTSSHE